MTDTTDMNAPAAVPQATQADPNKPLILVAEDDHFYARIYETKLSKEGFNVQVVSNGDQVLEFVQKQQPRLILLDLLMPIRDGFDTLKALKESATTKNIPVIIISNLGQEEDMKQAMSLGAVDYFVKANLSIEEMVERVKKNLQ